MHLCIELNKFIMKKIKNIIFDLGGVILNIDYHLTSKAFKDLGNVNFDELYSQAQQNNIFNKFETGKLSGDDFVKYLQEFIPLKTKNEIEKAWNSMLLDLPLSRIDLLKSLGNDYRIFLLSNTNEIHINYFTNYVNEKFGKNLFQSLFENHYYSNEIGLRKPNMDAFNYVITQNKLKASETLFIDDSEQHIKGANKVGLNTYFLKNGEDISSLFLDKSLSIPHL